MSRGSDSHDGVAWSGCCQSQVHFQRLQLQQFSVETSLLQTYIYKQLEELQDAMNRDVRKRTNVTSMLMSMIFTSR